MNKSEIQFHEPRRRDRAMPDEEWIVELLTRVPLGTLATVGEERPSLNPNLFVFDSQSRVIFLHTARKGQTRDNIEKKPQVSFSVAEMGRLLPSEAAVSFSVEYSSVIVEGQASLVDDSAEAKRALDLFMHKYAPHLEPEKHYRSTSDKDLARTSVFKVEIESWSGKGKTSTAADAYTYDSKHRFS